MCLDISKHYVYISHISSPNAAFFPYGLLPKLWFANQMSQVCLRFSLYPAIINTDFAFADSPLSALWLAVARQLPQLTAETQRQNKYNKTNKQAAEHSHHGKHFFPHCVCIHVISSLKIMIFSYTRNQKQTSEHTYLHINMHIHST